MITLTGFLQAAAVVVDIFTSPVSESAAGGDAAPLYNLYKNALLLSFNYRQLVQTTTNNQHEQIHLDTHRTLAAVADVANAARVVWGRYTGNMRGHAIGGLGELCILSI